MEEEDYTPNLALFEHLVPEKDPDELRGEPSEEESFPAGVTNKEKPAFYRVCGYVLRQLLEEKKALLMCNTCHAFSINNPEAGSHPYAAFLRLTN